MPSILFKITIVDIVVIQYFLKHVFCFKCLYFYLLELYVTCIQFTVFHLICHRLFFFLQQAMKLGTIPVPWYWFICSNTLLCYTCQFAVIKDLDNDEHKR